MPFFGRQAAAVLAAALFLVVTTGANDVGAAPPAKTRSAPKGGKKPAGRPAAHPKPQGGPRAAQPPPQRAPLAIDLPFASRHLAGGVLAIALPSATAQVVAVTVIEGAGAAWDPAGRGGLAALRARLDGTRATAEQRTAHVVERGGEASVDVEVEQIVARYVLPAGELRLPLWLEHDRLEAHVSQDTLVGSLRAMTEAREADRRARARSALDALVFSGLAPYAHDPDGTADELLAIRNDAVAGTLPERPARPVVVVIAGAIDAERAFDEAERELSGIAARPSAPPAGALPDQTNQREGSLVDARATTGTLWLGFAIPTAADGDSPAVEVAAAVLANGPRARLERTLVDDGLARRVEASLERRRGPSVLRVAIDLAAGADPVRVREVAERTMLELGKSSPPPDEVRRAIAWLEEERVRVLSSPGALATEVARMAIREPGAFTGPKGAVRADLDRWSGVTGDAVARVVATHLSPIRRSVLEVKPEHPVEAPAGIAPPPAKRGRAPAGPVRPAAPVSNGAPEPRRGAKPGGPVKGSQAKGPTTERPPGDSPAKGAGKPPRGPAKKRGKP